jgi:hypothetical protein
MGMASEQTLAIMCVTTVAANVQSQGLNMGNGLMNWNITNIQDMQIFLSSAYP